MNRSALILLFVIPACVPDQGAATVQEDVEIVVERPKNAGNKQQAMPAVPAKVYRYTTADLKLEQQLTVNYSGKDRQSLAFRLETTRNGCHFSIAGDAQLKPETGAGEVDEDNQGNAYEVREYVVDSENFSLVIRMAYDEEEVRIQYAPGPVKKGLCVPVSDVLMIQK
jgi:hypothetical protein